MLPRRLLSDLVADSKIKTEISGPYTRHTFYAPGCSANERQVRREEQWVRQGFLGQGAFGTVYKERCDLGEGKGYKFRAVKEIRKCIADEEMDYTRELEAVMKFSHPRYSHCFIRSDGWFESADSVFIAMEYLELGDLEHHLTQPLPEPDAKQIITQVLEGLIFMHENDFVHRDLKPANIMVVTKHPRWFVKITDFGISKRRLQGVTTFHTLQRGTLGFIAPEVLGLGPDEPPPSYTFAVDLWSLGAVTHRVLTNAAPFKGLAELVRYATGRTKFPVATLHANTISEPGHDFVITLMSPDPSARPPAVLAAGHPWIALSAADEGIGPFDPGDNEISTTLANEDGEISKTQSVFDFLSITEASGTWASNATRTATAHYKPMPIIPEPSTSKRVGAVDSPHDPHTGQPNQIPEPEVAASEFKAAIPEGRTNANIKSGTPPAAEISPRSVTFPHERNYADIDSGESSPDTIKAPRVSGSILTIYCSRCGVQGEKSTMRNHDCARGPIPEPLIQDQSGSGPGNPQQEKRWIWLGEPDSPVREKPPSIQSSDRVQEKLPFDIVPPPRMREEKKPLKGILKTPTPRFPEDPNPIREGVAPRKDDKSKAGIPADARWTKLSRKVVSPEALDIGKERYEVRDDFVIILRVLSKEEILAYCAATATLREREEREQRQKSRRRSEYLDRDRYGETVPRRHRSYEGN